MSAMSVTFGSRLRALLTGGELPLAPEEQARRRELFDRAYEALLTSDRVRRPVASGQPESGLSSPSPGLFPG